MVRPVELQQVFSRFEMFQCESVPAIRRSRRNQVFLIVTKEFDRKLLNVLWSIVGEVNNSRKHSPAFSARRRSNIAEQEEQEYRNDRLIPAAF
jgi:hypothetical protein